MGVAVHPDCSFREPAKSLPTFSTRYDIQLLTSNLLSEWE